MVGDKAFEGMFFPEKEEIISLLDKFKQSKLYRKNLIPNNLGILLHGSAGCGKTSMVMCISHYLNMSCNVIDMCTISTVQQLKDAIKDEMITVFDEFDYIIEKILSSIKKDEMSKEIEMLKVELMTTKNEREQERVLSLIHDRMEEMKHCINLGSLLNFLDGVEKTTGRIIIATTNNPDRIPKPLLRPGRFGYILKMGYMKRTQIKLLLEYAFDVKIQDPDMNGIEDDIFSPAEIIEMTTRLDSVPMVLSRIKEGKQVIKDETVPIIEGNTEAHTIEETVPIIEGNTEAHTIEETVPIIEGNTEAHTIEETIPIVEFHEDYSECIDNDTKETKKQIDIALPINDCSMLFDKKTEFIYRDVEGRIKSTFI